MGRPRNPDRDHLKLPSDEEIELSELARRERTIAQDTRFQAAMMAAIEAGLERPTG